jgi:putative ABC transport system substrate-binding protein
MLGLRLVVSVTLALVSFFSTGAAEAQQTANVARIGWLGLDPDRSPHLRVAFLEGLRDLGYVEGRNFVLETRYAGGSLEHAPAAAAELAALKLDVIVAATTPTALAAKHATRTIPIVFPAASDPVTSGLVSSLARPGGNVTGLSFLSAELVGKHLELLKQALPGISRVAVLWQPGERPGKDILKGADVAARPLGLRLHFVEVPPRPDDFDRAFSEVTKARAGALSFVPGGMFVLERQRLVDLAAKHRLPTIWPFREAVDAGGLMSYAPHLPDQYRRAATYVDKILKGARPGDLPVEQPTRFELVINLRTARTLGVSIPASVLARADQVIEK